MAISPARIRDQQRLEQPPKDYCLRLAQEMKAFPRKHRLAEFRAEVVVEQTQVLSDALETAWSKSFPHSDKPKRVDQSDVPEIADLLHREPQVQATMATLLEYPPSKWLLEQELIARGQWQTDHPSEDVYFLAESLNLKGICFSGGGIRSATFNLGVLQGLASLDKLGSFDYLSTVSGGGYIHSFLASWISRDRLDKVQRLLQPLPSKHAERTLWPEPLRWLRRYSNYLTPQVGLFTADTWVTFAIWLRNALLNQIVLIATILFVLALPHWRLSHTGRTATELLLHGGHAAVFIFVCFAISAVSIWFQIGPTPSQTQRKTHRGLSQTAVLCLVLLPLIIASFVLSPYLFRSAFWQGKAHSPNPCVIRILGTPTEGNPAAPSSIQYISHLHELARKCVGLPYIYGYSWLLRENGYEDLQVWFSAYSFHWWSPIEHFNEEPSTSWVFVALLAGVGLLLLAASRALPRDWRAIILLLAVSGTMSVAYIFVGFTRIFIFASSFYLPLSQITRFDLAVIPPIALAVVLFSVEIGISLLGNLVDDSVRDWFARFRIWSLLLGILWFAWICASLVGARFAHDINTTHFFDMQLALGWIGTTAASVLAGKTSFSLTSKNSLIARLVQTVAVVGPLIFIAGLVLNLSYDVEKILTDLQTSLGDQLIPHPKFFSLLLILAVVAAIFVWRIDLNEFSLHSFYRDRIARYYIVASDPDRRTSIIAGTLPADKRLRLVDLLPESFRHAAADLLPYDSDAKPKLPTYQGPFPIFCATVNLSFGEDLAYQERKCAAFAFTPLYCGYDVDWTEAKNGKVQFNGYVPTLNYAYYDGGPRMATAVAASGCANTPNWGYHSSPTMAFLLTIFNMRLGLWIRNPRRKRFLMPRLNSNPPSPALGLFYPLAELLGFVNDEAAFVYLTDGGHFENTGLYELVRRHCMTIVICDAEADSDFSFQGLANAIRKCRGDFGAEITIDVSKLRPAGDPPVSKVHSVQGEILYSSGACGKVLYVKSTISKKLPLDLINYRQEHPEFPSGVTSGQEFSESQFESYRRLGETSILTYPASEWLQSNLS